MHHLSDKIEFDVSREGPSSEINIFNNATCISRQMFKNVIVVSAANV